MPLTIFSNSTDNDGVLNLARDLGFVVTKSGEDWQAVLTEKTGLFKKERKTTLTFKKDYCSPPIWGKQVLGMINYVANFPMEPEKRDKVLAMVGSFRNSIGIVAEPEIEGPEDHRLKNIHQIAKYLDGVLFTPGAFLDPNFLAIIDSEGRFDEAAVFPFIPEITDPVELKISRKEPTEKNPPSARRVARRMMVMMAVAARGLMEMNLAQGRQPAYTYENLTNWVDRLEIEEEFEPEELSVLQTPPGQLPQQKVINAVWRHEGIAVLAWALNLFPMPPYDQVANVDQLMNSIGFKLDPTEALHILEHPVLRSPNALDLFNRQVFAFHWRMVDFRVRPTAIDYEKMQVECWFGQMDLSWATLKDRDLVIAGKPISKADPNAVNVTGSIAAERHIAANWLIGTSEVYSETDAST